MTVVYHSLKGNHVSFLFPWLWFSFRKEIDVEPNRNVERVQPYRSKMENLCISAIRHGFSVNRLSERFARFSNTKHSETARKRKASFSSVELFPIFFTLRARMKNRKRNARDARGKKGYEFLLLLRDSPNGPILGTGFFYSSRGSPLLLTSSRDRHASTSSMFASRWAFFLPSLATDIFFSFRDNYALDRQIFTKPSQF